MRIGVLILASLLALPAVAQPAADPAAGRAGPSRALATPKPTISAPLRSSEDDPSLTSPGLQRRPILATPRLGREVGGGAPACRSVCASQRYSCVLTREKQACTAAWAACVTSCQSSP
jgi:hypothetical protein